MAYLGASAQLLDPAKWQYKANPAEVKVGDIVDLQFQVKVDADWYIYSSDIDPDLGPMPTVATFEKNKTFELVGKLVPQHPKKKYDDIWMGDVTYFVGNGVFIQKVKILAPKPEIKGKLTYQTCTERDGSCVPGSKNFSFDVKATASTAIDTDKKKDTEEIDVTEAIATKDEVAKTEEEVVDSTITDELVAETSISQGPLNTDMAEPPAKAATGLWKFLLLALGAGFASIFMPCIYPIMPMTVSYFTKQTDGIPKAIFYGVSIMVIFALMGFVAGALGAPFLNTLSTHWVPNLLFFIIFILFGISLLGAFEIVLPHGAVNKIDRLSDKGGLIGIFFMALTLVVVSFSCTVPFVGSLLILSAEGETLRPVYGMLAFGFPFAAVFTLLAVFPHVLKQLPKSGGWLNELKAVFGFLEFALALKFLSNIDLAYHLNLLHRNVFILLWVLVAVLIGLYIMGYLRLAKDDKITERGPLRWIFALFFFGAAWYMIPGVANKSLPLLSGILPPMGTSAEAYTPTREGMKELVLGLEGFKDYDDALAYAAEIGKPVMIDFTGHACANCRKMEENVWPESEILTSLQNDFVIASLYVDDKEELPADKHYTSTYDNQLKTTVGEKNMDLEITKFNNNAQPYYVIVSPDGEVLNGPRGYSTVNEFSEFLKIGKEKFINL